MAAVLSMPPRDKCPGCHAAIYDGAREQGWCTDCMPPEIEVLRVRFGKRRFSAIVSDAVQAALSVYDLRGKTPLTDDELNAEKWYAMYHAQCSATDALAKTAAAKSDKALLARIEELESQNAKLNKRIAQMNDDYGRLARGDVFVHP